MRQIIFICCIGLLLVLTGSCKRDVLGPIKNDGVAPSPVSNVTINNLSGAAEITFNIPSDPDLLYIKAKYTTKKGEVRETKVSRYHNSLTVEGFADTSAYEVSLYAVDQGENASVPVSVVVHPKVPPMQLVRNSLNTAADFGGINVDFKNISAANMAIVVLANDSLGHFVPANTHYSNLKKEKYPVRDLAAVETRFGIFVRDRWGNVSDTLYVRLTPYFEARLDRTKMRPLVLPTDAVLGYTGTISGLFDGDLGNSNYYHSGDGSKMPQWFTFDMGVTAKISRMNYYMRQDFLYGLHNPRKVEIWGSNNPPSDGSFTNWILLATHEQIKPSGLPDGQLSQADREAALQGEIIPIPADAPKVRYIRFKTLRNWTDGIYVNFNELAIWGDQR